MKQIMELEMTVALLLWQELWILIQQLDSFL